jgi:hypothetical protein
MKRGKNAARIELGRKTPAFIELLVVDVISTEFVEMLVFVVEGEIVVDELIKD